MLLPLNDFFKDGFASQCAGHAISSSGCHAGKIRLHGVLEHPGMVISTGIHAGNLTFSAIQIGSLSALYRKV